MAKGRKSSKESVFIEIQRLERAQARVFLLGTTPLLMNRMAAKAKQQLLVPPRTLNKAARASQLKHDPPAEYRDSVYMCRDDKAPTAVHIPNNAIKKSMASASLDTPGATKAETGRLVKVLDGTVHIYGKPYLHMSVVRQAGPAKTPDIRTRAIFPEWCCSVSIQYIRQRIRENDILNLVGNAGDVAGVGDGRTEKGTFDFGSWEIVAHDDPRWQKIARTQGRKVQLAALEKIECFDEDSEELLAWYQEEIRRREQEPKTTKKAPVEVVIAKNGGKRNGRKGAEH